MITRQERCGMNVLHSQQGAALLIAVLILLVLTVIGVYAVTTSTLETKIAGSERVLQESFQAADGGTDYGRRVITLFIEQQSPLDSLPDITVQPNEDVFRAEILGADTGDEPFMQAEIGRCGVEVWINRLMVEETPGYSAEFGKSASEKQTAIYYAVDSQSTSQFGGGRSEIYATYRKIVE